MLSDNGVSMNNNVIAPWRTGIIIGNNGKRSGKQAVVDYAYDDGSISSIEAIIMVSVIGIKNNSVKQYSAI